MKEKTVSQPPAQSAQQKFSDLPTAEVDRSTFDMSHPWKGTMDTNQIVPTLVMEVLPGDTFDIKTTAFLRLATPIKPIMDNLTADIHYFFVPNRLVWDNWQFFMGERKNVTDDPTTKSIPELTVDLNIKNLSDTAGGRLADFFGLPMVDGPNTQKIELRVNALPFRAYSLIYNDWYRNENLINEVDIPRGDGPDPEQSAYAQIRQRHKKADYFTRALPWPQKGDPVFLPLGTQAPVLPNNNPWWFQGTTNSENLNLVRDANDPQEVAYVKEVGGTLQSGEGIIPLMYADLQQATAATINDIRTAFQIQRLLERDARGGTRYIEIILSHFNVQSPDARLQRPEYLGGGNGRITVNPVAATATAQAKVEADDVQVPQGNLAGVGTGLVKGRFKHSFTEHGYIFSMVSARADLTYQRGLDRIWTRKTRYDFYWPALSHLGEQTILNKEIFHDHTADDSVNDGIWGYQERYAEYRYQPGRITGKFRSADPQSLDVWHLSQDINTLPGLNIFFVTDVPPIARVSAVTEEPHLLADVWHDIKATRPMPVYAVPGMVDHF